MTDTERCAPVAEAEVREIATLLSKAAKNYQVYLPNNRMFISSLAEVKKALERYLEAHEILTLVVKEFELVFDGATVYSNPDKHQSLAFRMYRDGVRLISFHSGITEEELIAFFEALTKCLECENLEEDFVTILWEKDLQSITYYEVSDYDTDYEQRRGAARNIDPEFQAVGPIGEMVEWTEVAKDVERLMPALELSSGDLEEAKGLNLGIEDDLFIKRIWQVVSSTLEVANAKETCLDIENAIVGLLDLCVSTRQLGAAAEVLSEITTKFGALGSEDVLAARSRIVESRHSEANMKVIAQILSGGTEAQHDQCQAYLSQLGPAALPAIVGMLPGCTRQSARQTIVLSMASIAKSDPAQIVRCAESASEEESDAILDALAAIGNENALACAMRLHTNPSSKIRAKVASLAGRLKSRAAVEVTQTLLQDENPSVRRTALGSIVEIGGSGCVQTLANLFTSKEFNLLERDRKTSMLLALRKLSSEDQKNVVEAVMGMHGWRLRKALEETKSAVIDILHLMHPDVVDYFDDELLQHLSGRLRKAAEHAIKKARRDERIR
ncbi:MAG TPA: HEAT repeat domain-containing protein [bacterium]|nr:HEAT repeat domain-containing protein [bacterium]